MAVFRRCQQDYRGVIVKNLKTLISYKLRYDTKFIYISGRREGQKINIEKYEDSPIFQMAAVGFYFYKIQHLDNEGRVKLLFKSTVAGDNHHGYNYAIIREKENINEKY